MKTFALVLLFTLPFLNLLSATKGFAGTYTSKEDPQLPEDFKFQGEYSNDNMGAQVIGLDKGAFHLVLYPGGLPGAGWDGKNRSLLHGSLSGKHVKLSPAMGKRKYLAGPAEQFSATRQFPPQGHQSYEGSIKGGKLTIKGEEKTHVLQKTIRKSPTLGKTHCPSENLPAGSST